MKELIMLMQKELEIEVRRIEIMNEYIKKIDALDFTVETSNTLKNESDELTKELNKLKQQKNFYILKVEQSKDCCAKDIYEMSMMVENFNNIISRLDNHRNQLGAHGLELLALKIRDVNK